MQRVNACSYFLCSFLSFSLTGCIRGQLCTDLDEVIQAQYHQQIFAVLIPTLEVPEPRCVLVYSTATGLLDLFFRVHAHAAAALINFCEGVERDTLLPYLDPIVERLLKLLNPSQDGSRPTKRYVQEQAVTTLAMVADASETTFAKVSIGEILFSGPDKIGVYSTTRRLCRCCSTC